MVSPALNTMRALRILLLLLLLAVAVPLHGKPLWKRYHDGRFPKSSIRHYPSFHTENAEYIPLEIFHHDSRISMKIASALNHIHGVVFNKTHPRGHDWSLFRPSSLPYPPITQRHQGTTVSQPTPVHSEVLEESSSTTLDLPHTSKSTYPTESSTHATTPSLIPQQINTKSPQNETSPNSDGALALPEEETQTTQLIPYSFIQRDTTPNHSIPETTTSLTEKETEIPHLIPYSWIPDATTPTPLISEVAITLQDEETTQHIVDSLIQHDTTPNPSISDATNDLPEEGTQTAELITDLLAQHVTAPSPSIPEATTALPEEETETTYLIPDSFTQHETIPSPPIPEATIVLPDQETETTHLIPNSLIQQHSTVIQSIPEITFDPHETELSTTPIVQEIETSKDELVTQTVTSTHQDQTDESQIFENPEFINIISEYFNESTTDVTVTNHSLTADDFETTTSLEKTTIPTTTSDEQDFITSDEFINIVSHYIDEFPTAEAEHNTTTDAESSADGGTTSQLQKIVSSDEFLDTVSRILNESTEKETTGYPTEESSNGNPETTPAALETTESVTSVEFIDDLLKFINDEFPETTEGVSSTAEVDDTDNFSSEFDDLALEYLKEINASDEPSEVILLEDEGTTPELQTEVATLALEYISPEVDRVQGPSDDVVPSAYEDCTEEDLNVCTQIVSETKLNTSAGDQGKDEKETTTPVSNTSLQPHEDGAIFTTDKADVLNPAAEGLETTTGDSGDYYTSMPADTSLPIIETGEESTTDDLSLDHIFSIIGEVYVTPKNSDQYNRSVDVDENDNKESVTMSKVDEEIPSTVVQTTEFDFAETRSGIIENHQNTTEKTEYGDVDPQTSDHSTQHPELAAETTNETVDFSTDAIRGDDTMTGKYGNLAAEEDDTKNYGHLTTTETLESVTDFQSMNVLETTPNENLSPIAEGLETTNVQTSDFDMLLPYFAETTSEIIENNQKTIEIAKNDGFYSQMPDYSTQHPELSAETTTESVSFPTEYIRGDDTTTEDLDPTTRKYVSQAASEHVKIVNYDNHLTTGASQLDIDLQSTDIDETTPNRDFRNETIKQDNSSIVEQLNASKSAKSINVFQENSVLSATNVSLESNNTKVINISMGSIETRNIRNNETDSNTYALNKTTTQENVTEEYSSESEFPGKLSLEHINETEPISDPNKLTSYRNISIFLENFFQDISIVSSENSTFSSTDELVNADSKNNATTTPDTKSEESDGTTDDLSSSTTEQEDNRSGKYFTIDRSTENSSTSVDADNILENTTTAVTQEMETTAAADLSNSTHFGPIITDNSSVYSEKIAATTINPQDEEDGDIIALIPTLVLEVENRTLTVEEKTRLHEMDGALWPSIQAAAGLNVSENSNQTTTEVDQTISLPSQGRYRREAPSNSFLENGSQDYQDMVKSRQMEKPNSNRYGRKLHGSSVDLEKEWEGVENSDDRTLDIPHEAMYRREANIYLFLGNGSQDIKKPKNLRRKKKPNTKRTDIKAPNADWKDGETPDDRTLDIPYEARHRREAPSKFFLENGSQDFQKMDKPQRKEKPNTNRTDRKLHGSHLDLDADWEENDEVSLWESREERAKFFKNLSKEAWEMLSRRSRSPGKVHPSYYVKEDGAILELINPVVLPTTPSSRDERRHRQ